MRCADGAERREPGAVPLTDVRLTEEDVAAVLDCSSAAG